MDAACLLNSVQAVKTETVQTRQLLWISEWARAHRTGYFFMQIVQQGFYIHPKIGKQSKFCRVAEERPFERSEPTLL